MSKSPGWRTGSPVAAMTHHRGGTGKVGHHHNPASIVKVVRGGTSQAMPHSHRAGGTVLSTRPARGTRKV